MTSNYDHIVIGAGVIGTATAYWLARSGAKNVLVLEQFGLGHGKGASEDHLTATDIRRQWPQWQIEDDVLGMFQQDGGILDVRTACAAQIAAARTRGVEFSPLTTVLDMSSSANRVTMTTDRGVFTAGNAVVCVASWIEKLAPSLELRWNMSLTQEHVSYFATPHLRDFTPDRFPMWIWHGDDNVFYGFPIYGEAAVKIARDMSGHFITSDERSYEPRADETATYRAFLGKRLPRAVDPELLSKTCVYDMPPDCDFILDRVPGHPRITIGVGAGHAAKFGNLIGHILSDLTLHDKTPFPIEAFRADRPTLTDPSFVPQFRMMSSPVPAPSQPQQRVCHAGRKPPNRPDDRVNPSWSL